MPGRPITSPRSCSSRPPPYMAWKGNGTP
jgi:hypothetical protein